MSDDDLSELLRSMGEAPVAPPVRSSAQRDADLAAMLAVRTPGRRRLRGRVLVTLAALVAAIVGGGLFLRSRGDGALATVHGTGGSAVLIRGGEARTITGLATERARAGDRIATLDAGSAVVTLDGALIALGPRSELGVLAKGGAACEVRGGRSRFTVERRSPTLPFVVRARDVDVIVHGTTFDVWIDAANAVHVHVDEGVVGVVPPGRPEVHVRAGEDWPPAQPVAETPPLGAALSVDPAAGDPPSSSHAQASAAGSRAHPDRHTALPAPSGTAAALVGSAAGAPLVPSALAGSPSPTGPTSPSSDLSSQNELLLRAAAARRSGDVVGESAALDELVRRFPSGVAAHDAVAARMRAARASGDRSKAESEARRYLSLFPNGPLRAEASALLP